VEKTKGMEIKIHKENPWENIETKIKKFNQKLFPKTLFFDFPNPSKTPNRLFN